MILWHDTWSNPIPGEINWYKKKKLLVFRIPVPKNPEKFHTRTRYEKMRTRGEKMRRWYENRVRENPETGQVFFEKP